MDRTPMEEQASSQMQEVRRIVRVIAMFSPKAATDVEKDISARVDAMFEDVLAELLTVITHLLDEKFLNQEDEDSSGELHMLMKLYDNVQAMTQRELDHDH